MLADHEPLWLVEGAKKAVVAHVWGTQSKLQVIGMPSENNVGGKEIEEKLIHAKQIGVWLQIRRKRHDRRYRCQRRPIPSR